MDFNEELKRIGQGYESRGYRVVLHPTSRDLPPFAADFAVELVARRGDEGVIVSVKKDLSALAADIDAPRRAEVTATQRGWRFDLVVLEGQGPLGKQPPDAAEFSADDIEHVLSEAEHLTGSGFVRAAVVSAWAGLEAAMRMRLRAAGERAGWGTAARAMANELFSAGILPTEDFRQIERVSQLRNEIVHGFASPAPDPALIQLLTSTARRLVEESQPTALAPDRGLRVIGATKAGRWVVVAQLLPNTLAS